MEVGGAQVASALVDTWMQSASVLPGAWMRRADGMGAGVTGIRIATLNGVWSEVDDPDPEAVAQLLDDVAASGLPYCAQLRPGTKDVVHELLARRGMVEEDPLPVMVLDDGRALAPLLDRPDLDVRLLAPSEALVHATVAAGGFGGPVDAFAQLVPPDALELPGVCAYVGTVDGEPVTTGLGVRIGDSVGVFNIATPAAHRRRGYGAVVTARIVADGLAAGARWAWLQSSQEGYGVYERLGFRTIETWRCWVTPE